MLKLDFLKRIRMFNYIKKKTKNGAKLHRKELKKNEGSVDLLYKTTIFEKSVSILNNFLFYQLIILLQQKNPSIDMHIYIKVHRQ